VWDYRSIFGQGFRDKRINIDRRILPRNFQDIRMWSAPVRRGLFRTMTLVSIACDDLSLRGRTDTPVADTASNVVRKAGERPSRKANSTTSQTEARSFADIRRALRRLVVAEETFFAENGTYTDDLSVIRFTPGKDITTRFLWLSRDGWAASGTHAALPDKDCVIFVGKAESPPTTLKYVRVGRLGVPVCDDRSAPPKPVAAAPRPATPAPAPSPPDTVSTLDILDPRIVMKVDLRNLAHSQETYFKMQGSYARRPQTMALRYLWHRDVAVTILAADGESWAAKATHAKFPGKSCVIWYGPVSQRPKTDAQQKGTGRSGVPVCDD
jgi:hypothetical protein